MRKGLASAVAFACTLLACSAAAHLAAPARVAPPAGVTAPAHVAAPADVAAPAHVAAQPSKLVAEPERVRTVPRERLAAPVEAQRAAAQSVDAQRWDAVPVAASEATQLAQQLITAERAVRDAAVTGAQLAYMGHLQQLVYRRLIDRPDLRDAVFDAIPSDLRAAADLNFAASADLWVFGPIRRTTLPAWRIVEPAPMEDLLRYYHEAEAEFGVPWYYLAAINLVETRMGRIRGDSYAGAQGPMQFMPRTWAYYGEGDVHDPRDAILGAGRYLRAVGAPARMDRAIWWYNHDDEYVDAVKKYAEVMRADPSAYRGFYGWQVYFQLSDKTVLLPVGWSKQ